MWGAAVRRFLQSYLAVVTPSRDAMEPRAWRRYQRRRRIIRRFLLRHRIQIASFGGAGTTLLCSWLGRHPELRTPRLVGDDWAPWKHMRTPPSDDVVPDGYKAIYVVSDPRDAVASVFRRDFQNGHVQRLEGDALRWNFTWSLDRYVAHGEDLYRLGEHVRNWTEATRRYPILVVHYETLWDHLGDIARFVGLPDSAADAFPPRIPRSTDWRVDPAADGLDKIYGELATRVAALPDAFVLQHGRRTPL